MATKRIDELTAATALTGDDLLVTMDGAATTKKITAANARDYFAAASDPAGTAAAAVVAHAGAADPHADRAYTDAQIAALSTYPTHVFVPAVMKDVTNTGFAVYSATGSASWFGAQRLSNATVNNAVTFSVNIAAGTYEMDVFHLRQTDRGIYTVSIDGSALGTTIDGYNAGGNSATRSTITGITIAASGAHTVTFTMATKNAGSSAYKGALDAFSLTRTGA